MRWTITIEGTDEFATPHRSQTALEKDLNRVAGGALDPYIADGKALMAHLQEVIVKQQCAAYVLARRFCADCQRLRPIKDYCTRRIRAVFGTVEVSSPRIMNCRRCLPHFCIASVVLRDSCPVFRRASSKPIDKPGVTAPIASATSVEQVQSLVRSASLALPAADLDLLDHTGP